jgi:EF-P beta-lysylation protein EpmB
MTKEVFTDKDVLLQYLGLDAALFKIAASGRSLKVPASFVGRMNDGDPTDPLLLQVLPSHEEDEDREGFSCDPAGDAAAIVESGLLQKYSGRALLLASFRCAIHCRFCFRRNLKDEQFVTSRHRLDNALLFLERRPDIRELILSGGDPLMLPNDELDYLLHRLSSMDHLARIRIHTRLPIADPTSVDEDLIRVLKTAKKPLVISLHANHPNELNDETAHTAERLSECGAFLLNQSVLLKGVNDNSDTLIELSEKLFAQKIAPYYLHRLDKAKGAHHFDVPVFEGRLLVEEMRVRCPGYLVPKYVQEVAGMTSKVALL